MMEVLSIKQFTVGLRDDDGELYVYPRVYFPTDLTVKTKFEFRAGQFSKAEDN